ncbi:MAG: DUF4174 domain-containing protein [Planctomycetales bacterium]|nr:DUF4174 domain-containing protein [Planctomycetales bacterium]
MTEQTVHGNELSIGHTLLYVFSPSRRDRLYQLQMETLADRQRTLEGHDVVIAEVFEYEQGHVGSDELRPENSHELRRDYHIMPGQFKVVLVGKDSNIKLRAESCVSCEEVIMRVENEPIEMESVI